MHGKKKKKKEKRRGTERSLKKKRNINKGKVSTEKYKNQKIGLTDIGKCQRGREPFRDRNIKYPRGKK